MPTTNFTAWTDRNISGDLSDPEVLLFAVDPRSPFYQGTGAEVNGWVVTRVGVDYIEDLFSATPHQHAPGARFGSSISSD